MALPAREGVLGSERTLTSRRAAAAEEAGLEEEVGGRGALLAEDGTERGSEEGVMDPLNSNVYYHLYHLSFLNKA